MTPARESRRAPAKPKPATGGGRPAKAKPATKKARPAKPQPVTRAPTQAASGPAGAGARVGEVLAELERAGTPQNRKVYARHGAGANLHGVSFGVLRPLAKRLGTDHALALALWASGNEDARLLATMVADPAALGARQLDAWVADLTWYCLADAFSALVARSPLAVGRSAAWRRARADFTRQAGWNLVGCLARDAADLPAAFWRERLAEIRGGIASAPNRTRHAMNMALVAIGGYLPEHRAEALAVARAIGRIEVDHGETGCKTPDAAGYIARMAARGAARAQPRGGARPAGRAATRRDRSARR